MTLKFAIVAAAMLSCAGPALSAEWPDYYPQNYGDIVEGSKSEPDLMVYTSLGPENWKPVLEGFNKHYPNVVVKTVDLGNELYERYRAERASGVRSADLIVTSGGDNWHQFVQDGLLLPYKTAEADKLPAWASSTDGLYAITVDPMLIVYNKFLIKQAPTSLADIAKLLEERPDLKGKVTTYNASSPYAMSLNYAYVRHADANLDILKKIGPSAKLERSAGTMLEKIASGEYALGYFVSSTTTFPRTKDPALSNILGWTLIQDGTPVIPRGVGIPKDSKSVNSAKLLLDYLVSAEGQVALGKGGVTPFRPEVNKADVVGETYETVKSGAGGEKNIAVLGFEPMKDLEAFKQTMRAVYPSIN